MSKLSSIEFPDFLKYHLALFGPPHYTSICTARNTSQLFIFCRFAETVITLLKALLPIIKYTSNSITIMFALIVYAKLKPCYILSFIHCATRQVISVESYYRLLFTLTFYTSLLSCTSIRIFRYSFSLFFLQANIELILGSL